MNNIKIKIQNKINTISNDEKTITNISTNNLTFTPGVEDEGFTNYGVCKQLPVYGIIKEVSKELDDNIRELMSSLKIINYDNINKQSLLSYFITILGDTYYLNSLKLIDKYDKLILSPYLQKLVNVDSSIIPMINKLTRFKDEFYADIKNDIDYGYLTFDKSPQHYYGLESYLPFIHTENVPFKEDIFVNTNLSNGIELLNLVSSSSEWFTIKVYSGIMDYNACSEKDKELRPYKGIEMTSEIRLIINTTKENQETCQN